MTTMITAAITLCLAVLALGFVSPNDTVIYRGIVAISGPVGVPYKLPHP